MKEPVRLPRAQVVPPRKDKRSRPRTKQRKRATRLKRVPGGKALARLNMFLLQRGVGPEPTPPPPPIVPGAEPAVGAAEASTSPAPAAALAAAHDAAMHETAASAAHWQPLGPFYIPHGQSYGKGTGSRPSVAGRVAAIAVDPGNDQHILCGSAGGGVWETIDGGLTWEPRTDDQPSISIGAVVFDPSNALRVYAGTGEGNAGVSPRGNVRAAGLLVSDDGGTTWRVMPGSTFTGISFFDLVVDPADSKHLLAATTNGLYETTDGGDHWTQRSTRLTWSVSIHPITPGNPAASREVLAACDNGLFRSTDGGTTWNRVPLPTPVGTKFVRLEARHSPTNGGIAYVFAAHGFKNEDRAPIARLLRRSTFDGEFKREMIPPDLETEQAWYDWFAAVAPNNPDVVYVGAINAHRGIRQSSNNWIWTNLSAKDNNGDCTHPDQHTIAFSPTDPNVIYIGNDGGLYRSPDAGVTWASLNKGLCITEVEFLAQHPEYDAWLLAGTQDNGTIRYEGQQTWYHVQDGDGGDCGVDHTSPYTCYHSFYGPYIGKSTSGGGWDSWSATTRKPLNEEESLFYPPLEVNGNLVVRGATRVWISANAGVNWTAHVLTDAEGYLSALAAPTSEFVYAATENGEFYRLTLQGSKWTVTKLQRPATGYISDIVVDPTKVTSLWCTLNADERGRVFYSDDGGITWSNRSVGLPNIAYHAIEIDAAAPDTLFLATDVGVYSTRDGGNHWSAFGSGMPNVLVKDLLLHPNTRLLRAGTQARGVWEISLADVQTPDAQVYLRDHAADTARAQPSAVGVANPFAKGTNVFWWQSPDIKIDASPFEVPSIHELDFDVYSDDRDMPEDTVEFATGLREERPVRGQLARVYVQVHNRGRVAARNVAARVFFIRGGLTWPDLPANFWNGFPNNHVPASSPWQSIAPAHTVPRIESGRSAVVGFNWPVPLSAGNALGLLAVITTENDAMQGTTLNVPELVRNSRFCALRNIAVMNPPALSGPKSHATVVDVLASSATSAFLDLDSQARSLIRGIMFSKALAATARKAGWKEVKLSPEDRAYVVQIVNLRAELARQIDIKKAFHPPSKALGIELNASSNGESQPILLLFKTKSTANRGSVVIRNEVNVPIGGITIVNRHGRR